MAGCRHVCTGFNSQTAPVVCVYFVVVGCTQHQADVDNDRAPSHLSDLVKQMSLWDHQHYWCLWAGCCLLEIRLANTGLLCMKVPASCHAPPINPCHSPTVPRQCCLRLLCFAAFCCFWCCTCVLFTQLCPCCCLHHLHGSSGLAVIINGCCCCIADELCGPNRCSTTNNCRQQRQRQKREKVAAQHTLSVAVY